MSATRRHQLLYREHALEIAIEDERELVLRLDGVVRKRRARDGADCVYVWTNVELHWEEHHFIEARWWPDSDRLLLTANGVPLLERPTP